MRIDELEFKNKEEIRKAQEKLLRESLNYILKNSLFYKERLSKIDPGDVTLENIGSLPFTTKEDLQKRNNDFLSVPKKRVVEYVNTSGTTGAPIYIALSSNDLIRLKENEMKSFTTAGATDQDTFQLAVTLDSMFIAGMAYYLGITGLGAKAIRVGTKNTKMHLKVMKELRPNGIVSVPTYLIALSKEAENEGIRPKDLGLKKAVLIGESIKNRDFSMNNIGKAIQEIWDLDLYSTYGNTEIATSMCECKVKRGGHIHPDLVYCEVINEKGNVLPEGETGELTVTTFRTEAMPLIRYRTGDITFMINEKCECGRSSPRIGPILGREKQAIKLKGTAIYPSQVEDILNGIPEVVNYVLEAYIGDDHGEKLHVRVGSGRRDELFRKEIGKKINAHARVTPEITLHDPEMIRDMQYKEGDRKPRRFFDRRDNGKGLWP
ncbi:MAG: AMP-binding protein [Nitrospirota bacterium]